MASPELAPIVAIFEGLVNSLNETSSKLGVANSASAIAGLNALAKTADVTSVVSTLESTEGDNRVALVQALTAALRKYKNEVKTWKEVNFPEDTSLKVTVSDEEAARLRVEYVENHKKAKQLRATLVMMQGGDEEGLLVLPPAMRETTSASGPRIRGKFNFTVTNTENGEVITTGVMTTGKAAQAAGLKAGDVKTALGADFDVENPPEFWEVTAGNIKFEASSVEVSSIEDDEVIEDEPTFEDDDDDDDDDLFGDDD